MRNRNKEQEGKVPLRKPPEETVSSPTRKLTTSLCVSLLVAFLIAALLVFLLAVPGFAQEHNKDGTDLGGTGDRGTGSDGTNAGGTNTGGEDAGESTGVAGANGGEAINYQGLKVHVYNGCVFIEQENRELTAGRGCTRGDEGTKDGDSEGASSKAESDEAAARKLLNPLLKQCPTKGSSEAKPEGATTGDTLQDGQQPDRPEGITTGEETISDEATSGESPGENPSATTPEAQPEEATDEEMSSGNSPTPERTSLEETTTNNKGSKPARAADVETNKDGTDAQPGSGANAKDGVSQEMTSKENLKTEGTASGEKTTSSRETWPEETTTGKETSHEETTGATLGADASLAPSPEQCNRLMTAVGLGKDSGPQTEKTTENDKTFSETAEPSTNESTENAPEGTNENQEASKDSGRYAQDQLREDSRQLKGTTGEQTITSEKTAGEGTSPKGEEPKAGGIETTSERIREETRSNNTGASGGETTGGTTGQKASSDEKTTVNNGSFGLSPGAHDAPDEKDESSTTGGKIQAASLEKGSNESTPSARTSSEVPAAEGATSEETFQEKTLPEQGSFGAEPPSQGVNPVSFAQQQTEKEPVKVLPFTGGLPPLLPFGGSLPPCGLGAPPLEVDS